MRTTAATLPRFWTLAVEEQFYLIWPLLVLQLSNKSLGWLTVLMLPSVILYRLIARLIGIEDIAVWVLLPNSMDALCFGAFTAVLTSKFTIRSSQKLPLMAAGAGLALWLSDLALELPDYLQFTEYGKTGVVLFFWVGNIASIRGASGLGRAAV